jgi:SLOG-like protein
MSDTQTMAAGWKLALSISETPDLEVLGLFEDDDKRFLSAILTPLVYRGARIAYGGRIEPASNTNFTQEISTLLAEAYRKSESKPGSRPLIHYLRDKDARREGIAKLFAHALKLGSYSEIKLLHGETTTATLLPSGRDLAVYVNNAEARIAKTPEKLTEVPQIAAIFSGPAGRGERANRRALAGMHAAMARETDGRIILGGRVKKHAGIIAEACATLDQAKPLLVVGGIGGASRDAAWVLGLIDEAERVERDAFGESNDQGEYWAQMEKLRGFAADYRAMLEKQGLFEDARRLAISESHAEIGTLVITMLSKLLGAGSSKPKG